MKLAASATAIQRCPVSSPLGVNSPLWWPLEVARLAGFRYREIARKLPGNSARNGRATRLALLLPIPLAPRVAAGALKAAGFQFDRQAARSHEIRFNPTSNRYTAIPNHPGDMPEGTLRAILKQGRN